MEGANTDREGWKAIMLGLSFVTSVQGWSQLAAEQVTPMVGKVGVIEPN